MWRFERSSFVFTFRLAYGDDISSVSPSSSLSDYITKMTFRVLAHRQSEPQFLWKLNQRRKQALVFTNCSCPGLIVFDLQFEIMQFRLTVFTYVFAHSVWENGRNNIRGHNCDKSVSLNIWWCRKPKTVWQLFGESYYLHNLTSWEVSSKCAINFHLPLHNTEISHQIVSANKWHGK